MWKSLTPQQQEAVRVGSDRNLRALGVKWQKQNADAIEEMRTKHGTQILRTPPDILIAFLKAWDEIAAEESAKNPFFKKVLDSQRAYAAKVVPAKRFMFPPYSFAANYYWPEEKARGERPRRRQRRACGKEREEVGRAFLHWRRGGSTASVRPASHPLVRAIDRFTDCDRHAGRVAQRPARRWW